MRDALIARGVDAERLLAAGRVAASRGGPRVGHVGLLALAELPRDERARCIAALQPFPDDR